MVTVPRDWQPDTDQMLHWPEVSGNTVNGLDEDTFRRPRHVYWADDPDEIPHGAVQRWFYGHNTDPAFARERAARAAVQARPLPDTAATPQPGTPPEWSALIKAEAARLGAEAVGIARIDPDWVYEGRSVPWRFIVVLGIAMEHDALWTAPETEAGLEVMRQYTRCAEIARGLTGWLRERGHDAAPAQGPMSGDMVLIPAAIAAGLGELGKHGSLIHPELGSCFRLAAVLTDLEVVPDEPLDFGADGFCSNCRICDDHCPPQAILPEKQTVRGVQKWYVDFDRCLPFFNETAGCGICLAVCPFSRPGVGNNLVAKLARRRGTA